MSIKGDWSRVKDQKAYGDTLDAVQAAEKLKRDRMARALLVTGGKIKKNTGGV